MQASQNTTGAGAVLFFADYVQLYKSSNHIPSQFRFTPSFEKLIEKWNRDWTRTWNDFTRTVELTPQSDYTAIGARLQKSLRVLKFIPDFSIELQRIQQGEAALVATKLGVDFYPTSDELLFNLGYFLIMTERTEQGRAIAKRLLGDYERPLVYFKRAFAANPGGVMAAPTFIDFRQALVAPP